jgi:outer membrane immunogenic protein
MRRWLVASCMLGSIGMLSLMTQANAQDFETPTLRGSSPYIPAPPKYTRWQGFYVGGQIGYGTSKMDFSGATESLVAFQLRETALEQEHRVSEWDVLGKASPSGTSYGGFVGYNFQFSDVIVGIDVHYNGSNFFAAAPVYPIGRAVSAGGNEYTVILDGDASMRITDYGSARFRAGWLVGNVLPYATLGFAFGRADISRSVDIFLTENGVPFDFAQSETRKGRFIYGWSAGAGLDVLVMPNIFVRGEVEYISFSQAQGIEAQITTARLGAGFKF